MVPRLLERYRSDVRARLSKEFGYGNVHQVPTVTKVVLPTSLAGIITGITLAVARVIGETAPLLIIAGSTDSVNLNLFSERMMTLPVFIYYSYTQPGVPAEFGQERTVASAVRSFLEAEKTRFRGKCARTTLYVRAFIKGVERF